MKIKRFESADLFDDSILNDFFIQKESYFNLKNKICKLITEFRQIDKNYITGRITDFDIIQDYYHLKEINRTFRIFNGSWIYLSDDDFKNLLEFLKDPELYKNSRKYNL
jgi:hypothetical protein